MIRKKSETKFDIKQLQDVKREAEKVKMDLEIEKGHILRENEEKAKMIKRQATQITDLHEKQTENQKE